MNPKHVSAEGGSSVMTEFISAVTDILLVLADLVPPERQSALLAISAFIVAVPLALWLSATAVPKWLHLCSRLRGREHIRSQERVRELKEFQTDLGQYNATQNFHGWHPDLEPVEGRIRVRKKKCEKWKLAPPDGSSDEAWHGRMRYIIPYLETSSLKEAQRETRRLNTNVTL